MGYIYGLGSGSALPLERQGDGMPLFFFFSLVATCHHRGMIKPHGNIPVAPGLRAATPRHEPAAVVPRGVQLMLENPYPSAL